MSVKTKEQLFDVRVVQRNIRKGLIKPDDLKKHLKSLTDVVDKSQQAPTGSDHS